jgi:hypothetical protein
MISTKNIESTDPLKKFYENYFTFSYSSLNKLLRSAHSFYSWYILKEREDNLASYLVEGKVIHCLLLEEASFKDQFAIMPGQVPGVSNKKITEYVYNSWKQTNDPTKKLEDYKVLILQWMVNNNLHQNAKDDKDMTKAGAKTGDEKRIDKFLTHKSIAYFDYLKESKNKEVIDQASYDRCKEAVSKIKENKAITDLLQIGRSYELLEVHNEKALSCALNNYPFGLKGIVDNYVIDHSAKKVYINDLKTTGKSLSEFKDTVNYYKYWMQGAIYTRLVESNHPEVKDYEFIMHFIVIDNRNQVYPFPVSVKSMLEWQSQLEEVLEIAKYHYTNKDYTLPYEFALNQVTL